MVDISVIIPTYNRAEYLNELLESLVCQKFKNFEVLVCDDGSIDNTKEIVTKFNDRLDIRYFYESNWGGPAKPRNLGVKNARAEWICFVDSDDLWTESKLFEVSKVINKNVDVIYHLFKIKGTEQIIGDYGPSVVLSNFKNLLFNGNRIVNSSLCVRKSLFEAVGGFNEVKPYIGVEDFDLLIRLAKQKARFYFIKRILGEYRINETNISKDFSIQVKKIQLLLNYHAAQSNDLSTAKITAVVNYMKGSHLITMNRKTSAKKFLLNSLLRGSVMIKGKSFMRLLKCFYGK